MKEEKKDKWQKGRSDSRSNGESNDSIRRMKLVGGVNVIRIVEDNYEHAWVHHFVGVRVNNEVKTVTKRRSICLGKSICPICLIGEIKKSKNYKARHRYYFNVIDRAEQKEIGKTKIKILECGAQIYDQVAALVVDDEYGNPTNYDIKITRTGKSWNDTKYTVMPSSSKVPLRSIEIKKSEKPTEDGGCYNLLDFTEKKSIDEVLDMMRGKDKKLLRQHKETKD